MTSYSSTELDRALASSRIVAAIGPVADLDTDRIARGLARARAVTEPRIALVPDHHDRRWPYRSDIEPPIVDRPGGDTDDLGELLTTVRARESDRPLEIALCGDHLVVDYSHGIGDGRFGLALLSALSGPDDPTADRALGVGLPSSAVWTALRRQFATHPARLADVVRLRSQNAATDAPTDRTRTIENWTAAKRSVVAHMDADTAAELRQWVAENNSERPTAASVTVTLWRAALRSVGVCIDDRVMILIDCRRYLDERHHTAHGNFAVGIPIHIPSDAPPAEVTRRVRAVTGSGWPVAILGLAEVRSRLRPGAEQPDTHVVEVPDRARLSVSDLGRLTMFDHVTWNAGRRPPSIVSYVEPDGPDAITMLVTELRGVRAFTASFCSDFIAPEVVTAALHRMCSDPMSLLKASRDVL
ncbi:hypothetical protein GCM10009619_29820 [Williamsia maris]